MPDGTAWRERVRSFSVAEDHVAPALEAALLAAVRADVGTYWDVIDLLPARPADAFVTYGADWETLATAIEAGIAALPSSNGKTAPTDDPVGAARQLSALYQRRALAVLGQEILRRTRDGEDAVTLLADLEQGISNVAEAVAATRLGTLLWGDALIGRILAKAEESKAARAAGKTVLGVPSGHVQLDQVLNGFGTGLYLLGGPPGAGKTSLALWWACEAARKGYGVLYVSYENSAENLALKAISRLGGVSPLDVERGMADLGKLRAGAAVFGAEIAPHLALLEGSQRTTLPYIQARARQVQAQHGGERILVVVDYVQKAVHSKAIYQNLRENVSALTLGLREMANRLDSPVVALSSLSRGANNYKKPVMESLKESGDLEFSADVVMLLAEKEDVVGPPGVNQLGLFLAKNRNGPAGHTIDLVFRAAIGDFREEARQ
jgi:replicative DNA helicase